MKLVKPPTAPQNSPDSLAEGLRRDVVDLGLTTFETAEDDKTYTERKKKEDKGERRHPRIAGDRDALHAHLRDALAAAGPLGPDRPVVLFVHGFQFDPRAYRDQTPGDSVNPHVQLFRYSELQRGADPEQEEHRTHATPWLKRAAAGDDFPGLAVCFGYESWGDEFDVATSARNWPPSPRFLISTCTRARPNTASPATSTPRPISTASSPPCSWRRSSPPSTR